MNNMVCVNCNKPFTISSKNFRQRSHRGTPEMCDECLKEHRRNSISNKALDRWKNIDKNKFSKAVSDGMKKSYEQKSDEERLAYHQKLSNNAKVQFKNYPDDKKSQIRSVVSDKMRYWYANATEEQLSERNKKISDAARERFKNMSPEELQTILETLWEGNRRYWNSLSDEERHQIGIRNGKNFKRWWDKLSTEEKNVWINRSKEYWSVQANKHRQKLKYRKWWTSLPEEKLAEWSKESSERLIRYWNSLSDDERERRRHLAGEWYRSLPDEEKLLRAKIQSEKMSARWENMSEEEFIDWNVARSNALKLNKESPKESELQFMFDLTELGIQWDREYCSTTKHPEFDKLFPLNPITGSKRVNPYHLWDFIIHGKNDILIDVDGSIHSVPPGVFIAKGLLDVGANVQFNDSQRPYQTDGLDAYIIEAHNGKINEHTPVQSIHSGEVITYSKLIEILLLESLNVPKQDVTEVGD